MSVHDPDEYLATAANHSEKLNRFQDILHAYRALTELKSQGKVKSIGIGSKDWRVIQRICEHIRLDWVMIANSMTIHSHREELVFFLKHLEKQAIMVINSAVFNGGFLTGSDFYNYQLKDPLKDKMLYSWRDRFYQVCQAYEIKPAEACVSFGLNAPGVKSIALNTTNAERVASNVALASLKIPPGFWEDLKKQGLIDLAYMPAQL